jgi:hypothetical protein
MKLAPSLVILCGVCLTIPLGKPFKHSSSPTQTDQKSSVERKLDTEVEQFDTSGRTILASVIELAYEYQLPTAVEYIDGDFATRPISMEFRHEPLRRILEAIIQKVPEYRLTFSGGIVDIYVPKARDDSSNFLNKFIKNFVVTQVDTQSADMDLVCALAKELVPPSGCFGSFAPGQWGPLKITVHMQNSRVYEILNAIVAENGKAIWIVTVSPDRLSKTPLINPWHIYPLEGSFKETVLDKLTSVLK